LNLHADVAFITVYFPHNTIAHINVNWLSPVKVRTHGKFVLRDRHRIMIDFWGSGRPLASGRFSPSAYGQAWRIGEYRSPATDGCEGS
jgi:hypothetical protein